MQINCIFAVTQYVKDRLPRIYALRQSRIMNEDYYFRVIL